jgi:hypothetical protein
MVVTIGQTTEEVEALRKKGLPAERPVGSDSGILRLQLLILHKNSN